METAFGFRPLAARNLPMIHGWFRAPHARRWYEGDCTLDEVREEYLPRIEGVARVAPFVATYAGRDVGLVEWCRLGDHPDVQALYRVADPETANCDVILGDEALAHRGLGATMIREFLAAVVFADARVTSCVIDPETDNAIAIRAYEKAGFSFVRAVADDGEGHSVYLLELTREDFARGLAPPPAITVRPARPGELAVAESIDDDACALYAEAGRPLDLHADTALARAERASWSRAVDAGRLLFACADGVPVGFAALGEIDGAGWLEQLSVRRAWMRRGVGRALLTRAKRWSVGMGALWLTTWDDIAWNAPWYAREGFVATPEGACGEGIRAVLGLERDGLPRGDARVAMVYRHRDGEER